MTDEPTKSEGEKSDDEYDQFEDLARKLVAVPKRELDDVRKDDPS